MNNRVSAVLYLLAIVLGITAGAYQQPTLLTAADEIACLFVRLLKWFSLPMLFLAVTSAVASIGKTQQTLKLFKSLAFYTVVTTIISASVALGLYLILKPSLQSVAGNCSTPILSLNHDLYSKLLISTLTLTVLVSLYIHKVTHVSAKICSSFIKSAYTIFMAVVNKVFILLPLAVWAFIVQFVTDIGSLDYGQFKNYLLVILGANLIQALIVLPSMLKLHGISSLRLFKNMQGALSAAFWSKSSCVALPVAIDCAVNKAKLNEKVVKFSLPLCITINMNACAAFILSTVLFVSASNGIYYSPGMLIMWIFIATLAAIGNAGIPMGCFTLSAVILSYTGVPLAVLGLILPFYSLIDMLESAINVWSDSCVTAVVENKYREL